MVMDKKMKKKMKKAHKKKHKHHKHGKELHMQLGSDPSPGNAICLGTAKKGRKKN